METDKERKARLEKMVATAQIMSQQKNLNKILSDLILEYKILFQKVRS